jgi:hypothetical protein
MHDTPPTQIAANSTLDGFDMVNFAKWILVVCLTAAINADGGLELD